MADEEEKQRKVVEFYSGIGGMHYALKACSIPNHVVAAIDINTTANKVYTHNFPDVVLLNRNIEGIKLDAFMKFNADVFVMSPPCQPFTRQGHQRASSDARTKSFLHIMDILRRLPRPPTYILMENVKGFEMSDTRQEFMKTLKEINYTHQEFLLTPMQFGVPNSRLRYFLIAVQKPMIFPFQTTESIMEYLPVSLHQGSHRRSGFTQKTDNPRNYCTTCSKMKKCSTFQETPEKTHSSTINNGSKSNHPLNQDRDHYLKSSSDNLTGLDQECSIGHQLVPFPDVKKCKTIQRDVKDFLEVDKNNCKEFLLPENILRNKVMLMDIIQEGCNHSCCFTKGYGHYVEGTGSVLQGTNIDPSEIFSQYNKVDKEDRPDLLTPLGLRYFTPREISNIHYFPKDFAFPKDISTKQKYRLLGNSLNVLVLTELMELLFSAKMSS